jgi:hypothetical protein
MSSSSFGSFPNAKLTIPKLTPLDTEQEPTTEAIRLLRLELYANARNVPTSTLGGGQHGHLGLLMPAAEYLLLAGHPYILSAALPDIPDYTMTADDNERKKWGKLYDVDCKDYYESHGMNMQLRSLLLEAVPLIYLSDFNDPTHGFSGMSLRTMLTALIDTYGTIHDKDLEANWMKLRAPWNPDSPIVHVFANANNCRRFAIEGGEIITDTHFIREIIQVFINRGVFPKAIGDWDAKPRAAKTLAALKAHFTQANRNRRNNNTSLKGVLSANTAATNGAHKTGDQHLKG